MGKNDKDLQPILSTSVNIYPGLVIYVYEAENGDLNAFDN
jgi:hypothetical protein